MKLLLPVLMALLVALFGCSSKPPEKTRVSPEVIRDAMGINLQGWEDGILPDSIKNLKPIRVYADRANRVIALSQENGVESGYYVYIPISSYLPTDNGEWTFSTVGEDIWTYKRKLGAVDKLLTAP